jgi:predicted nucleic acid-binding protein
MANKQNAPRRVVWDTCTLIWCLDNAPTPRGTSPDEEKYRTAMREATRSMIGQATSGQIRIVVPTMAIAETATPDTSAGPKYATQTLIIENFLRHPYITRVALDSRIAHSARRLRIEHAGLDLFNEDLIQVATAIEYNCQEFLTTDGDKHDSLKTQRRKKKGLLKYDGAFALADGVGKLQIWTPLERHIERERLSELEKQQERAAAAEQAKKKTGGSQGKIWPNDDE